MVQSKLELASKGLCPFPLTILNYLQFIEMRDPDAFKAEYLQTKTQDKHYLLKTEKRKKSHERLNGVNQFFVYFPEAVVLENPSSHQFVLGLKIYDPKKMDAWYLRVFVDGDQMMMDLLIRDLSVQTGAEILKTLAVLLSHH